MGPRQADSEAITDPPASAAVEAPEGARDISQPAASATEVPQQQPVAAAPVAPSMEGVEAQAPTVTEPAGSDAETEAADLVNSPRGGDPKPADAAQESSEPEVSLTSSAVKRRNLAGKVSDPNSASRGSAKGASPFTEAPGKGQKGRPKGRPRKT